MELYDISNLKKDIAQSNLYNFFDATYKYYSGFTMYQYTVNGYHQMRIDSICNDIYGTIDYCDFLLDLNDIDNPLNIMENDIILYVSQEQISYFHLYETTTKAVRNTYLNANKISQQDPNRNDYVGNNLALPPTFLQTPKNAVKIVGNKIVLGGNT